MRGGVIVSSVASVVATSYVAVGIATSLHRAPMAQWVLGRASGFVAYGLMVVLALSGLFLSHPAAARLSWPPHAMRVRLHVTLSLFTLIFTALHIVVLATDRYALVGWRGSVLPMAAQYRPVGVTLGVIAAWTALLTALTATLAGRVAGRAWWPIHKVAIGVFALVWAHGLWTGIDAPAAAGLYLTTGSMVLLVALSRYIALSAGELTAFAGGSGRS